MTFDYLSGRNGFLASPFSPRTINYADTSQLELFAPMPHALINDAEHGRPQDPEQPILSNIPKPNAPTIDHSHENRSMFYAVRPGFRMHNGQENDIFAMPGDLVLQDSLQPPQSDIHQDRLTSDHSLTEGQGITQGHHNYKTGFQPNSCPHLSTKFPANQRDATMLAHGLTVPCRITYRDSDKSGKFRAGQRRPSSMTAAWGHQDPGWLSRGYTNDGLNNGVQFGQRAASNPRHQTGAVSTADFFPSESVNDMNVSVHQLAKKHSAPVDRTFDGQLFFPSPFPRLVVQSATTLGPVGLPGSNSTPATYLLFKEICLLMALRFCMELKVQSDDDTCTELLKYHRCAFAPQIAPDVSNWEDIVLADPCVRIYFLGNESVVECFDDLGLSLSEDHQKTAMRRKLEAEKLVFFFAHTAKGRRLARGAENFYWQWMNWMERVVEILRNNGTLSAQWILQEAQGIKSASQQGPSNTGFDPSTSDIGTANRGANPNDAFPGSNVVNTGLMGAGGLGSFSETEEEDSIAKPLQSPSKIVKLPLAKTSLPAIAHGENERTAKVSSPKSNDEHLVKTGGDTVHSQTVSSARKKPSGSRARQSSRSPIKKKAGKRGKNDKKAIKPADANYELEGLVATNHDDENIQGNSIVASFDVKNDVDVETATLDSSHQEIDFNNFLVENELDD